MKIMVLIPAFNEEKILVEVLRKVKKACKKYQQLIIVVVNDGSKDGTAKVASEEEAIVISHPINRGLGAAIGTGMEYAKLNAVDVMVTLDADDQHNPDNIEKLIDSLAADNIDVVIGSRFLQQNSIPLDRKIIISLANLFVAFLYKIKTTDSQSGFRAFSKRAINKIKIRTQGMEVSTELFSEIREHKLKLLEVPIDVKYTSYSRSKGQSNLNSLSIISRLILRLAR
jgi:glycosyltransferase involved in cell wall biosynthesis